MNEKSLAWEEDPSSAGKIRIIPSEDVPAGFKRTVGTDIFVNSHNFTYMRSLSAKGTIIVVWILTELASR